MYIKVSLFLLLSFLLNNISFAANQLTLNKNIIKEVALTTSSSKGIGQSSFGHALLRFRTGDKWSIENDLATEFIAPRKESEEASFPELLIRGFGVKNFGVEVYVHPFSVAHKLHTSTQNRTLTNYPLLLTAEQKDKLIDAINGMIVNDLKYNFLKKNCTTFITNLLEEVVGKKIAGFSGNFPLKLPKKLKKHNLVGKPFINLSDKKKRNKLVDETMTKITTIYDLENFKDLKDLGKSLKADRMKKRRKAYDQLYKILKENTYPELDGILIQFIASVKNVEKEKNQNYLKQKSLDY